MGSWFSSAATPTTDDAPPRAAEEDRDVEQPPLHPEAPEADEADPIQVVQEDPFMLPPSIVEDAVFYANARNTPSMRPHIERATEEQDEQDEQGEQGEQGDDTSLSEAESEVR